MSFKAFINVVVTFFQSSLPAYYIFKYISFYCYSYFKIKWPYIFTFWKGIKYEYRNACWKIGFEEEKNKQCKRGVLKGGVCVKPPFFINEWQKFIFMSTKLKENVVEQDQGDKTIFLLNFSLQHISNENV